MLRFAVHLAVPWLFVVPCRGAEHTDVCDKASSQAELNACSAERYQAAEKEMNEDYRRLRARLRGKNRDLLTRAQNAWLGFRKVECELESSPARGGSAYVALHNQCLARITTARTEDLKRLMHDM
jgi:uncharacterized protein YecT (DUF1311 family)